MTTTNTFHSAPAKDTPIKVSELAKHDGSDPSLPIYVAIKGDIFDVTANKDAYGPGAGYSVFTGKDASKVKKNVGLVKSECWYVDPSTM